MFLRLVLQTSFVLLHLQSAFSLHCFLVKEEQETRLTIGDAAAELVGDGTEEAATEEEAAEAAADEATGEATEAGLLLAAGEAAAEFELAGLLLVGGETPGEPAADCEASEDADKETVGLGDGGQGMQVSFPYSTWRAS